MAYQQGVGVGGVVEDDGKTFTDPLSDFAGCSRDIPYLQQLGTNLVRVYAIDNTADHTQCMNALDESGIYVIADLGEPGNSINRDEPKASFSREDVVNLRSGSPVGPSQVTSVVRRLSVRRTAPSSGYRVAFRARLVAPFLLRLVECDDYRS